MNNVKSISSKEIVGRILRMNKNLESSYIPDLIVWTYEALRALETKWSLTPASKVVKIEHQQGCLPCGYLRLIAVEYCGKRLTYGGDISHIINPTHIYSNTHKEEALPNEYVYYRNADQTFDWSRIDNLGSTTDYYTLQFNRINTTFQEGEVRIHFLHYEFDEDGYPLIPDSEAVKKAVFWYLMTMLCGSGHSFLNPQFNDFNYLNQMYEEYNFKAIEDMTSITIDRMQKLKEQNNRLITDPNRWSRFDINSERREQIDIHLDSLDDYGNK